MKTKAAILVELNKPLVFAEIEIPKLKPGQVLVKIEATGICRTQLNEIKGLKGPDRFLPHLLGHEGAGRVVEVGPAVDKVKTGDFVVLSWIKGKGKDVSSSVYKLGNKTINAGAISTFSEYAVISENRITKISDEIPAIVASIIGCAVATGAGIVLNTLRAKREDIIAVFGVGGVGGSAIMAAKMIGCRKIIAVDITQEKLDFARKIGATDCIKYRSENFIQTLHAINLSGVDLAVEASGIKEVMEKAYESVKNGGKLAIAGNVKKGEKIKIDPYGLINGKEIVGTWGGETDSDRDIPRYIKLYKDGVLRLRNLITQRFKFSDINKALSIMDRGESLGRMIIEFI